MNRFCVGTVSIIGATLALVSAMRAQADEPKHEGRPERLRAAKSWMYQIAGLETRGAVEALAKTNYPLLVLEPGNRFKKPGYKAADLVKALRTTPDGKQRVLLAYIDIGQAENYRTYWGKDWVKPTATKAGVPDFLLAIDPDGWNGSYQVAYWDKRWKDLWLGKSGAVAELAQLGFDGVYLDWLEAYDDARVRATAKQAKVDAKIEMIRFVEEIRAAGRAVTPDFLVVPQNALSLLSAAPERYAAAIDGVGVEDTWFYGKAGDKWDAPNGGDQQHKDKNWTAKRVKECQLYTARGLPVFTVDYCLKKENADRVYRDARLAGLRPLVTRVSLNKLTVLPPE